LAEAVRKAGVITTEGFAFFQNAGYVGLYGGLGVSEIHKRKELGVRDKNLDFIGGTVKYPFFSPIAIIVVPYVFSPLHI